MPSLLLRQLHLVMIQFPKRDSCLTASAGISINKFIAKVRSHSCWDANTQSCTFLVKRSNYRNGCSLGDNAIF